MIMKDHNGNELAVGDWVFHVPADRYTTLVGLCQIIPDILSSYGQPGDPDLIFVVFTDAKGKKYKRYVLTSGLYKIMTESDISYYELRFTP